MRRASSLAALVVALLMWAAPASAQVWVATDTSGAEDASAGATLSGATTLDVAANEAIIVCAFNDDTQNITGVTDGTHTYLGLTQRNFSSAVVRIFYVLTTSAGSFTPTVSYSGTPLFRGLYAVSYTRTGTPSFATENGSTGVASPIDSDTLLSTGTTDLLTVACATSQGLIAQTDQAVYGMTASGYVATAFNQSYWDLRNHSSASGSATATIGSDNWVAVAAVFSSPTTSSSSGPRVGSVAALGAGR